MKKTLLLFLFLSTLSFYLSAEEYSGCKADNEVSGASKVWIDDSNGAIKFFKLDEPLPLAPYEMEAWLIDVLRANSRTGFKLYQIRPDKLGQVHYRFRQTHNGVIVNNGVYYVHTLNGNIISANGEFYPNIELDQIALLTESAAIDIGKSHVHSHHWAWPEDQFPTPELRIQLSKEDNYHLTYKTDIYSYEPLNRHYFMIDAISGEIVESYNRIHNQDVPGEAHCRYHGVQTILVDSMGPSSFRLRESTRGGGVETYNLNQGVDYLNAADFTDSDNIWDATTNFDDAALDAHWGTEMMYDYMLNVHDYESYDGNGAPMLSYIHYGAGFVNAFWDGERMTYGDGDGVDFFPLTSTEVVGHEIMHGVTENTAALIYSGESGGLNESYSDIFGVLLDYQINPSTANFRMGDDFMPNGLGFRNMGNPHEFSNPDTYLGQFWNNGGVHNQSGVQNYWFYLLTQGGSGTNDNADEYTVNPIPMADAADIAFRSLSLYLTPSSPYADARFYGIQSATELFGDCSDAVINVTNAWYAVGVGGLFNDAVVASFNTSSNFNCQTPATVQFTNNSVNGSTFVWDFGNGTTSTDENPVVEYTDIGTYTVSLISTGNALCGNSDTLELVDLITITNDGGPVPPTCFPGTTAPSAAAGVLGFVLETIDNDSEGGIEGYQDYTCTHSTNLQEGIFYPFQVRTGELENIRIWADLDNNGIFDSTTELVYTSSEPSQNHEGELLIPDTDIYGEPLRLRIKSDGESFDISNPCNTVNIGQVEDYTIIVSENVQAPLVDFVASETVVQVGATIDFTDLTENLPNGWSWNFEGGVPATSTEQNPSVTYPAVGSYEVSLVATNALGQDSEIKIDYINVAVVATACSNTLSNFPAGIFYDSGGPGGDYSNAEFCTFLIDPGCAEEVSLEFTSFNLESGWDFLSVYDGVDASGDLLGVFSGTTNPGTLVATSGKMFVLFDSDGSVVRPGWEATWTSVSNAISPAADFNISDTNPPLNFPVDFTDMTTEFPNSWLWDFGDGNFSTEQNPSHSYDIPGTYEIELIVQNCFDSDTITYSLVVQEAAGISVNPPSIDVTLSSCEDEVIVPLTVTNTGTGDLNFNFGGAGSNNLDTVLQRLNANFSTLTDLMPNFYEFIGGETGIEIQDGGGDMYDGANQLSVDNNPPIEYSNNTIVPNMDMGADGRYFTRKYPGLFVLAADIDEVDLFSIDGNIGADGGGNVNGAQLTTNHNGGIYRGFVKRVFNSGDPSINHLIIVKDNGTLNQTIPTTTTNDDHDVDGMTGASRMYYLLFAEANSGEYSNAQMQAIMDQFLEIAETSGFVTLPDGNYELEGGESQTFNLVFNSNNTPGGVYNSIVTVFSNDASLGPIEIPVTVSVSFDVCADFAFNQPNACGGQVDFNANSVNDPTSYLWDFGDGNTSTEANPTHLYTAAGTYTVTLTVENASSTDMITYTVEILDVSGPTVACTVGSVDNTPTFDISNVILNTISNESGANSNGYTDYTCEWSTTLVVGVPYDLTIEGYDFDTENVRLWIDLDNSGSFENDELLFQQLNVMSPHTGQITVPDNAELNAPLRMRIACGAWFNALPEACNDLGTGEFEDYTIRLESNSAAPDPDFEASFIDECVGSIQFVDLSTNLPTSWSWDFGDGSPLSTLQNPSHTYTESGTYEVTLTATNNNGSNSFSVSVTVSIITASIVYNGIPEIDSPLSFNANSDEAISWVWDFGDNTSSTLENPEHTYTVSGIYTVTLTVINAAGCEFITTTEVNILVEGIEELEKDISLYPNPTEGNIFIKNTGNEHYYEIQVINALGQVLKRVDTSDFQSSTYELTLEDYPTGMYIVTLKFQENQTLQRKFILQKDN